MITNFKKWFNKPKSKKELLRDFVDELVKFFDEIQYINYQVYEGTNVYRFYIKPATFYMDIFNFDVGDDNYIQFDFLKLKKSNYMSQEIIDACEYIKNLILKYSIQVKREDKISIIYDDLEKITPEINYEIYSDSTKYNI